MGKIIILFLGLLCFLFICEARNKQKSTTTYTYPTLFKDHIYYSLSEKGKEMFYGVNIHPQCIDKKGVCIPRAKCVGKAMLYISSVCYKRDLVCCYDSAIKNPTVGDGSTLTPRNVSSTTEYVETEEEP